MNSKLLLGLALVLSGSLFGCSSISRKVDPTVEDQPPVTLGFAKFHFQSDDGPNAVPTPPAPTPPPADDCQLSLIWVGGKHTMQDADPWCGDGEKYSGKFIFRVKLANGKTVDTPLESLDPDGSFDFFYAEEAQPWEIKMADYNNDGQPDFNIVVYGSCIYSECFLFTVTPSGKVEALKIDGADSFGMNKQSNQSTEELNGNLTPTGFYYEFYNRQNSALDVESFDWDAKQNTFHEHHHTIQLRQ